MNIKPEPTNDFEKEFQISGDKYIAEIALILAGISDGVSNLSNFPAGNDINTAVNALRLLGVNIEVNNSNAVVKGTGLKGLKKPDSPIETGDNANLAFLLTGLLSAQDFDSEIISEIDLTNGHFQDLLGLLSAMEANINLSHENGKSVIKIKGEKLTGKEHFLDFYSPAAKGALFLAGLYAENETSVIEAFPSHNHMENLAAAFGGEFGICHHNRLVCHKAKALHGQDFFVPGNVFYGLFFLCTGLLAAAHVKVKNISLNSERIGFLYTLMDMGAKIKTPKDRDSLGESYGDIEAFPSELKCIILDEKSVMRIYEELPLIITLCLFANGETIIKKPQISLAHDVKILLEKLRFLGGDIQENDQEIRIKGGKALKCGMVSAENSIKISLSLALCALKTEIIIENTEILSNEDILNIL